MVKKEFAKGYGSRYGPRVRKKYSQISKLQRGPFKCPYCAYEQVKRKAVGIWTCGKCSKTFTNKAYQVSKVEDIKSAVSEEITFEEAEE